MAKIKTVLFDVGDVLIGFSEQSYISWLSRKIDVSEKELVKFIFPLVVSMEYGTMNLNTMEKLFSGYFGLPKHRLYWIEGWKAVAKSNGDVVDLLLKLSKKYDIGIITNVSESRYMEARKMLLGRLEKEANMKGIITSYGTGMRKPEPGIYKYTLKKLKIKANETVFIDNMMENVVGARAVGMHAVCYTQDYKKLLRDLKRLGVTAR